MLFTRVPRTESAVSVLPEVYALDHGPTTEFAGPVVAKVYALDHGSHNRIFNFFFKLRLKL
jgi:hypothetical protein